MIRIESNFLLAQIAKQYYIDQIKQNEIAKRFNITAMMVSRYLRKAEQEGIVTFHIKTPWPQDLELGREVMEKFQLTECIALDIPENAVISEYIGKFAADFFTSIVKENTVIGISWGKTIAAFAAALPYINVRNCVLLQMTGAALMDDQELMPTRILQQVAHKLSAQTFSINSPLYVATPEIKETLINDPVNLQVQQKAEKADIAIIGASAMLRDATTMILNPTTRDAFDELVDRNVIGDLAGVFLDREGNPVQWSKSDLYMGIPLSKIAKAKNVLCLAGEPEKATILRAVARKKYIKTLITSKETARAILRDE